MFAHIENNLPSNLHCGDWFIHEVRLVHYWNQRVSPLIAGSLQGLPEQLTVNLHSGKVGRIS